VSITIVRSINDLRSHVRKWKKSDESISIVPTMGALHAGHLSLVREAKSLTDRVIVTLFVNPSQFDSPEDLDKYPRNEDDDIDKLNSYNIDLLYAPQTDEIYPIGHSTKIVVSGVSRGLCGDFRPGHFDSVATVVGKLLIQSLADKAFFGEKDFQQLHVIKRMVADLDLPVEIVHCKTIREHDQLALSSRNSQLSSNDRKIAPIFAQTLFVAARQIEEGVDVATVIHNSKEKLIMSGFSKIDYIELRAESDLRALSKFDESGRIMAAVYLGNVRLIDNVEIRKC
jgi:pantoate--beta-alanine ligase